MGGFRKGVWRRIAGAFGLVGVLLYTALIPGHLVSQTISALLFAELGTVVICHSGGDTPANDQSKEKRDCPFCHGYASFQISTLGGGLAFTVPSHSVAIFAPIQDEPSLRRAALTPQSRGPPQFSI